MRFTVKGAEISADTDGRSPGRGYYLCRDEECIKTSFRKKAWNRILKCNVDNEMIQRAIDEALAST